VSPPPPSDQDFPEYLRDTWDAEAAVAQVTPGSPRARCHALRRRWPKVAEALVGAGHFSDVASALAWLAVYIAAQDEGQVTGGPGRRVARPARFQTRPHEGRVPRLFCLHLLDRAVTEAAQETTLHLGDVGRPLSPQRRVVSIAVEDDHATRHYESNTT
jgi:hypothetical protein